MHSKLKSAGDDWAAENAMGRAEAAAAIEEAKASGNLSHLMKRIRDHAGADGVSVGFLAQIAAAAMGVKIGRA